MHHVGVRPTIRVGDRGERPTRGIPHRNQIGAEPVRRKAEERARELLVGHRRVPGSDAQARGHNHHAHRRLPEVVLQQVLLPPLRGDGRDERDGRRGRGDVLRPAPHLRQLGQPAPIRDEHEVPRLPVLRRRRPPAGLQDALEVVIGQRLCAELADVAS
jgi:hypothetical protein